MRDSLPTDCSVDFTHISANNKRLFTSNEIADISSAIFRWKIFSETFFFFLE